MRLVTTLVVSMCVLCNSACATGQSEWREVDRAVRKMLLQHPLQVRGASVYVGLPDGSVLYQRHYGSYDAETRVPLASASKLVSAVALMTLIESDKLDPDAPVSQYLPEFAEHRVGKVKSEITLEQMYSMTSGFPGNKLGRSVLNNDRLTLAESVEQIACCVDLAASPGTEFTYTGYGMHTAGRICEVVTGSSYDDFFDAAVNEPLGTDITWDGLGETKNFRPSGGGSATLEDYAKVLTLLINGGASGDVQVLEAESVDWMMTERTAGLDIGSLPGDAEEQGYGYAFGMWVESRDEQGNPTVLASPGFFGFTPWIDLEDGYVGIIMINARRTRVLDDINAIREAIDAAVVNRVDDDS